MFDKRQKLIFFVVAVFFLVFQPFWFKQGFLDTTKLNHTNTLAIEYQSTLAYEPNEPSLVTKTLVGESEDSAWVKKFYKTCLAIFNILVVAILLFVAIANILRINIATYEIKKIILPFLYAVLFANLALTVFVLISRVVDSLQSISIFMPRSYGFAYMYQGGGTEKISTSALLQTIGAFITGTPTVLSMIIGVVIVFGAWIIGTLLSLTFAFRPYIIFILTAISPIAIACLVLPQTEKYFKKWLSTIMIWLFLPVIAYGIINIGYQVPTSMGLEGDGFVSSIVGVYLPLLIRSSLLLLAIRTPFTLEKDISGLIQKIGKWTGTKAMALPGYVGSLQKNRHLTTWAGKDIDKAKGINKTRIALARQLVGAGKWATKGVTAGDFPRLLGAGAGVIGAGDFKSKMQEAGKKADDWRGLLGVSPVIPIAQLSNFSALRKLAIEKQKTREYEAALDDLGMEPMRAESRFIFHYDDNKGMYDDSSYDQINKEMGISFGEDGGIIIEENGSYDKFFKKFRDALSKGNLGKIEDEKSLIGGAAKFAGISPDEAAKDGGEKKLYAAFLAKYFAQTDSKSSWWKAFLPLETDKNDHNQFVEFIHAMKAKQRSSRSYFSPANFAEILLESEDQRNERVRNKTGRGGGTTDDEAPPVAGASESPGELGEDEDYAQVNARRDTENLRSRLVGLDPESISGLANAIVERKALSSEPEELSRAFAKGVGGLRQAMQEMGLDDESIDSISSAVGRGAIRTNQDLAKLLPRNIANQSQALFERLVMSQSSRALAYAAAGNSEPAQATRAYAARMASNFDDISRSTRNGTDLYEAADKIFVQESGLSNIPPTEFDSARQIIARALNISPQAVNQRVAQNTARAFEALGSISSDKSKVTVQTPELIQVTAGQQIRNDLIISASRQISDAVKSSTAASRPISDQSLSRITDEIQTALDLQLQISRPDLSGITDKLKREVAADITRQLVSRDFADATEQVILGDVQKMIVETKDKF